MAGDTVDGGYTCTGSNGHTDALPDAARVLRLRYHRNPSVPWAQSLDEQPRSPWMSPLPDIDRSSARAALLDHLNEMQVGLDPGETVPLLRANLHTGS